MLAVELSELLAAAVVVATVVATLELTELPVAAVAVLLLELD